MSLTQDCTVFLTFMLCIFLVWTLQYFQNIFKFSFAREIIKKLPSRVLYDPGRNFSTARRPKTIPNLKFCLIKMTHRATYIHWLWFQSHQRIFLLLEFWIIQKREAARIAWILEFNALETGHRVQSCNVAINVD